MDADTITTAAVQTLDEVGLEKLTMRAVAARLDVQVGGLYYHVPDKSALMRLMADRICGEILEALPPGGDWRATAIADCETTRRVLLSHRDGARILAVAPMLGSVNSLRLMAALLEALSAGVAEARVGTCADTLMSYLTGYVLQEQHDEPPAGSEETRASLAELAVRFPLIFAAAGVPSEQTFRESLEAILDGFAARPTS